MEPKLIQEDQIILVGFSFFGDPFGISTGWTAENEIGRLWSRFEAFLKEHGENVKHLKELDVGYEVHIEHPETQTMGHREVFVGMQVEKLEDLPVQLLVKTLPPTEYAVFTLKGEVITSDWWLEIYDQWLPASGYQVAYDFMIEYYDQRFKGLDRLSESEMDVYVPVKPA